MKQYSEIKCPSCGEPMEIVDGVTRCEERDCWPDCPTCNNICHRSWDCRTCFGLGVIGYTKSEAENEIQRRGEAADEEAFHAYHGGDNPFNDAERAEVDQQNRDFR